MPKKLFLSLCLTPMTDRILFAIFDVQTTSKSALAQTADAFKGSQQELEADPDDIYGFADNDEGFGTDVVGSGSVWSLFGGGGRPQEIPLSREAKEKLRVANVEQFVLMFKCLVVLSIYFYSVFIKFYRESNSDFNSSSSGLMKVLESMRRKIA